MIRVHPWFKSATPIASIRNDLAQRINRSLGVLKWQRLGCKSLGLDNQRRNIQIQMRLKPLTESDAKHLLASEGWLELGDYLGANDELENITAPFRAHPEVLECRMQILPLGQMMDDALAVAETLTEHMPGRPAAWVAMAECLQGKGDPEGAYEALAEVGEQFAEHPDVTYRLRCSLRSLAKCKRQKIGRTSLGRCRTEAQVKGADDSALEGVLATDWPGSLKVLTPYFRSRNSTLG